MEGGEGQSTCIVSNIAHTPSSALCLSPLSSFPPLVRHICQNAWSLQYTVLMNPSACVVLLRQIKVCES